MNFKLTSKYQPTGDQPQAIRQLTEGIEQGEPAQVLLGVTGSGKTFTVANVIANVGKANPRAEPQQDSCCTVVPGNEKFLSRKCCRVLCVLLRLLSARGLPADNGYLYRERSCHQRRDRQVAPGGCIGSAFRTERCHRGIFRLVYLWYGRPYRHAGEHHQDKERAATRQERVSATVSGCPVCKKRYRTATWQLPCQGRNCRYLHGL